MASPVSLKSVSSVTTNSEKDYSEKDYLWPKYGEHSLITWTNIAFWKSYGLKIMTSLAPVKLERPVNFSKSRELSMMTLCQISLKESWATNFYQLSAIIIRISRNQAELANAVSHAGNFKIRNINF